jgi:hypothetical protein
MKIYYFDPETGIYQGEDFADEAPLKRGVYVVPPDATTIAPPPYGDGQAPFFDVKVQRWEVSRGPALRCSLLSDKLNKNIPPEESL